VVVIYGRNADYFKLDITMSRAAFLYRSKKHLKQMSVAELDAYERVLKQRATIGGYVTKSAEKQLEVVSKVRALLLARALAGDV